MRALDTNVLVRLFVEDDAAQSARARSLVEYSLHQGDQLVVPLPVVLELVWVLTRSYGHSQAAVRELMKAVLLVEPFQVTEPEALADAINLAERTDGDLADALVAVLARRAGCDAVWTFDRSAAARMKDFQLVPGKA